jgi:hypothetical protein
MSVKTVPVVRAKTTFFVAQKGSQVKVARGSTAHADHPIVQGREELFEPFKVDFSTEVAPVAASSAGTRSLRKAAAPKAAKATKPAAKPEEKGASVGLSESKQGHHVDLSTLGSTSATSDIPGSAKPPA